VRPTPDTLAQVLRRPHPWVIPAVGAFTPLGLLVVEGSAFVMRHLAAFRLVITTLALLSGVFLNSWVLLQLYRVFRARWPSHRFARDDAQEVLVAVGVAVVLIVSLLTAYFCFKGLENPDRLPNWEILVSAGIALLGPVLLNAVFSRRRVLAGPPPGPAERA